MLQRMTVLITLILFTLCLASTGDAIAEEHELRGYLMLGGAAIDIDGLNSKLDDKGYTEFSDDLFSIGGGVFHKVSPRILVGGEGHFLIGEQNSSDIGTKTYASSMLGGYGFMNMGYLAHESDRLDVIPILGMGFGGIGVKIGESSFDDILDNPSRSASLYSMSFLLNLALETDCKVKILAENGKDAFFCVGVRVGYVFSPFNSGWYTDEISLTDDPDSGLSGPYIRLTIGGGGIIDK
jgi:hypothetical protein